MPPMSRRMLVTCLLTMGAALASQTAALAQLPTPPIEPDSGSTVCAPGAYLMMPERCVALGPSVYLTALGQHGLTLPASPLRARDPNPQLVQLPYRYFHVISDDPVTIGSEPGGGGASSLFPGFVYIAYGDRVDTGHGIYYLLQDGGWIPGKGERVGEIPAFQGLVFESTPRNSFGWTFEDIPVLVAPGYAASPSGLRLAPFTVIQIYSMKIADDTAWYLIGPDQWLEGRKVAQVEVNTTAPEGTGGAHRWIDVNLAQQTVAVYDENRLVFATMVATGVEPFWTRPGLFQITQKKESETMRNNDPSDFYYLEGVPWTMYFDGPRALHGAYWRTRFGYAQSHGCVNLSVGDAHWLFEWAREGDWVYVHDPTGQTPTDPALYTGGAY
jgi:hypothetical protein